MANAQLVHIAVRCEGPRPMADFYKRAFGVREVLSNRQAVDLWDGYLFLALNPPSANGPKGLNHFGFFVSDVDSLRPVLVAAGGSKVVARPAGRSFTDWRVLDPEKNHIDLSARGYDTIPAERLEKAPGDSGMCEIRRLVLLSNDPPKLAGFYKSVFQLQPTQESDRKAVLTDGTMELVILNLNPNPRTGLYCYGLAAKSDFRDRIDRLKAMGISVTSRPDWVDDSREQFHLADPEGNLVSVFEAN
jgi:catechol-2,3-dioxygenase